MGVIGSTTRSAQAQSGRRAALRESFERVQAAKEARDQAIQDRERQRAGMAYEAHASILGDAEKLLGIPEDQVVQLRGGFEAARTQLNDLGVAVPGWVDPRPGAAAADFWKMQIDPAYRGMDALVVYDLWTSKWREHSHAVEEHYLADTGFPQMPAATTGEMPQENRPPVTPPAQVGDTERMAMGQGPVRATRPVPVEGQSGLAQPLGPEADQARPVPVEGRSALAQPLGAEADVAGAAILVSEKRRRAEAMFGHTRDEPETAAAREHLLAQKMSSLVALRIDSEEHPERAKPEAIERLRSQTVGHEGVTDEIIDGMVAAARQKGEPTFAQKARAADVEFDNLMKSRSILAGGIDRVFRGHEGTDNEKLEWTRRARERMHAMDVKLKIADAGELPWRYGVSPEITEEQWKRLEIAARNVGISRERLDISRLSYDLAVRREEYVESKPTGEAKPDKYGRTDVAAKFQLSPNEVEQYGRFKFSSEVMLNHPEDIRTLMGDANEAEALRGDPNTSDWEWDTENKPKAVEQFKKRIQELNKEWGSGGGAATVSEAGSAGKLAPTVTVGGKAYKKKQCYRILRDRHGGKDLRDFPEVWNRKKDGKAVGGAPPAASIKPGDILYLTPDHWQEVLADGKHVYEMETVGENVRVRTDRTWMPGGGRIQNVYRTGGSGSAKTPSKAGFKKGGSAESAIDALIKQGKNRRQIWDTLTAQGWKLDSKATVAHLNKRGVPEWKP
jgi:hypothetical protein